MLKIFESCLVKDMFQLIRNILIKKVYLLLLKLIKNIGFNFVNVEYATTLYN